MAPHCICPVRDHCVSIGSITIFHTYTHSPMKTSFPLSPNPSQDQPPTKRHIHSSRACKLSGILALRVMSPQMEGFRGILFCKRLSMGLLSQSGESKSHKKGKPFRRRAEKKTGVSRNTSLVWCAACVGSPPRAHAPFESGGSGLPPSRTTQEANAAFQSASGFLQERSKIVLKKKIIACSNSCVTGIGWCIW